jgi:predicted nucleotidyltransferase
VSPAERIREELDRLAPSEIVSLYLFGSEAEGRAHRDSDVDLGVLFATDPALSADVCTRRRRGWIGRFESLVPGRRVDLVDLAEAPAGLAHAIVQRGRRLHCSDEEFDFAFRSKTASRAMDFAPWWRRIERLKLEALAPR